MYIHIKDSKKIITSTFF